MFIQFESYLDAPAIFRYDFLLENDTLAGQRGELRADDYETEQVWYESKDGVRVSMFLTHKKGMQRDGNNPTLLTATAAIPFL